MSFNNSDEKDSLIGQIIFKEFEIKEKLGMGSFSSVYLINDVKSNEKYAIKIGEKNSTSGVLLSKEAIILKKIRVVGFPNFKYFGTQNEYNMLIMELLGQSLEKKFEIRNKIFSLKTACMLGIQMIDRIEYLHYNKLLHGDIKPGNFTLGLGSKSHIVHLIDFGFSKKYWNSKRKCHIPFIKSKQFVGNPRFCSLNILRRFELSRRDDLESIGYVIMYFIRGSLPWQNVRANNIDEAIRKVSEKKLIIRVKELCAGFPPELATFISYTRNLEFTEAPDYNYLRYLLKNIIKNTGSTIDFYYDWCTEKPTIKKSDPIFTNNIIKYDSSKEWLFNSASDKNDNTGTDLV